MPPVNTDWTPERLAKLKELFDAGFSFHHIASCMALTRNAVLGTCYRMKWKRDLDRSKAVTDRHRAARISKKKKIPLQRRGRAGKLVHEATAPPRAPFVDPITKHDKRIPKKQRKQIADLTAFTCRWPVHDPRTPAFFFCGAPSAFQGYCKHHHATAWRKSSRKA